MDVKQVFDNFKTIVTRHYADFSGRASRAVFWQYILVYVVIYFVLSFIWRPFGVVVSLALFLPTLGVTIRRLHDLGKSGWWLLLPFVPGIVAGMFMFVFWPVAMVALLASVICAGYMIYLYAQPGLAGSNEFGPAPDALAA